MNEREAGSSIDPWDDSRVNLGQWPRMAAPTSIDPDGRPNADGGSAIHPIGDPAADGATGIDPVGLDGSSIIDPVGGVA